MKRKQVNWLDLPSHILVIISEKLTYIKDYIRFSAVCHSWQSLFVQNRHRLLPFLMLYSQLESTDQKYLSDLFKNIMYNVFELQLHDKKLRGFSEGWLVYEDYSEVHLFNPFLSVNNKINLPRIKPVERYIDGSICKFVLSVNPAVDPNFVVMAIYGGFDGFLAFYKPGNKAWNLLDCKDMDSVVYYKDQFYAMDVFGRTWACNVSSPRSSVSLIVPETNDDDVTMRHIVDSFGDLLQVKQILVLKNRTFCNFKFEVYKLDQTALKWVEIKSLSGRVLFFGYNLCMSLLASDIPGCKPDCIYYAFDLFIMGKNEEDLAVYSLEDGSTERHYLTDSKIFFSSAPIWIKPTLQGYST
ncbi:F-box skip23-like protein [Thalictrum thalictroides]|uniref:F-box skip23-like protein n=1 Tax=Thalictrum thalictroides TaxID=46969 RepID=A0A7J6WU09_THATH|nr:F-box skip23-like protein [Thalictrum thalictroides]